MGTEAPLPVAATPVRAGLAYARGHIFAIIIFLISVPMAASAAVWLSLPWACLVIALGIVAMRLFRSSLRRPRQA